MGLTGSRCVVKKSPFNLLLQLTQLPDNFDHSAFGDIWDALLSLDGSHVPCQLLEVYVDAFILHNLLNKNIVNGIFRHYWQCFTRLLRDLDVGGVYGLDNAEDGKRHCTDFIFVLSKIFAKCMIKRLSFAEVLYHLDYVDYFLNDANGPFNRQFDANSNCLLRCCMARQPCALEVPADGTVTAKDLKSAIAHAAMEKWSYVMQGDYCFMDAERRLFSIASVAKILPTLKGPIEFFIMPFGPSHADSCFNRLLEALYNFVLAPSMPNVSQNSQMLVADVLVMIASTLIRKSYLHGNDYFDEANDPPLPVPDSFQWVLQRSKSEINLAPFCFRSENKLQHQVLLETDPTHCADEAYARALSNIIDYAFCNYIIPFGGLRCIEVCLGDFDTFTNQMLDSIAANVPWSDYLKTIWLTLAWQNPGKEIVLSQETCANVFDLINEVNCQAMLKDELFVAVLATCLQFQDASVSLFEKPWFRDCLVRRLSSKSIMKQNRPPRFTPTIACLYKVSLEYFNYVKPPELVKGLDDVILAIMQWNFENHQDAILNEVACMLLKYIETDEECGTFYKWMEILQPILSLVLAQAVNVPLQPWHLHFDVAIKMLLALVGQMSVADADLTQTISQHMLLVKPKVNACEALKPTRPYYMELLEELERLGGTFIRSTPRVAFQDPFQRQQQRENNCINKYIIKHAWIAMYEQQKHRLWQG